MKSVALLVPTLAFAFHNAQSRATPHKYALVVAVGDYPAASGYGKISSANDVPLVVGALEAQGFAASDIVVLRDAEATQKKIFDAMHAMARRARPGDALVFHYSGHGHRVSDDNGDELDGLDEILVPYDAFIPPAGSTRIPSFIRDDDLGRELNALRAAVGSTGSVTVFLDACYSGSATRAGPDEPPVRGVLEPIILAGAKKTTGREDDDGAGVGEVATTRGDGESMGGLIVISAARHDQVDRETVDPDGKHVGPLSLAMRMTLPKLTGNETYRNLHDRIALAMAGMNLLDQRPQIEGAVDAKVFSGSIVAQTPYFVVTNYVSDTIVRVRGGKLLGLNPGTRMDLHRTGTADPKSLRPLATGVVRAADATGAVVVVDSGSVKENVWAFVRSYSFGDDKLRVMLDRSLSPAQKTAATRVIGGLKMAELVTSQPELVISDFTSEASLRNRILNTARSNMLRQLELKDALLDVQIELIKTKPRLVIAGSDTSCANERPVPTGESSRTPGGWTLRAGEEYTLKLTNVGLLSAYVSILDITPDNRISQLFPLPGNIGSDNYLRPGMSFVIPDVCFYAEQPAGTEVIKLFATRERLDFSPILSGSATRDLSAPLAQLFNDIYTGERSAPIAAGGSGSTSSITVNVVSAQRK